MRLLSIVLGLLIATSGCSTPCEELAKEICACEPSRAARTACERRAAEVENRSNLGDADQERCERWLETCDCNALNTAEGKRACGLSD